MEPEFSSYSSEELKNLLHTENFNLASGIDRGISFDALKMIRQRIRAIQDELEIRNLIGYVGERK